MADNSLLRNLACSAHSNGWRIEARVRSIAGAMILASLGLALVDHRWLWLTAFVGANLLQSGITGWCLLSNLLALRSQRKAGDA
ncbi:DUF2892 domain-containing protein [bacterium]|nr:MAG: DUF2892 domain-containing protein [bacterium]